MSEQLYTSAKSRINLYFNIIPNIYNGDDADCHISLAYIGEKYFIPIAVIRKDFLEMTSAYKKSQFLPFQPTDDLDDDIDNDIDDYDTAIKNITNGQWDNLPLQCNIPLHTGSHTIPLSADEYVSLSELFSEYAMLDYSGQKEIGVVPCIVKEHFNHHDNPTDLVPILDALNTAIDKKKQIYFEYQPTGKKLSRLQITPIKIIYDNEENLYSILGIKNKNYVVYKIESIIKSKAINIIEGTSLLNQNVSSKDERHIHILTSDAEKYDKKALDAKIPHVWKNAFDQKKPVHVRVKFEASVYASVRKDLAYRNSKKTMSKISNGYFFFEDDIYGIDAFDLWIRTYGSKAIILEPKNLAKKRIESIKQALDNYR